MPSFTEWTEVHKALADPTRLHILALLAVGELCVCELVEVIGASQPTVSRHLGKLKQARLVQEQRVAQWVFYSLDDTKVSFLREIIKVLPSVAEEFTAVKGNAQIACHIRQSAVKVPSPLVGALRDTSQ